MDDFLEQVVERKNRAVCEIGYYALWLVLLAAGFFGLMNLTDILSATESGGLQFHFRALLRAAVCGGIAFLCWKGAFNMRVEYDYTFTNGALDVARVLNRKKRVYLTTVEVKDLQGAGRVEGADYAKFSRESGLKTHKWYLNRETKKYFFYFVKNGVKHMMLLELSDAMAKLIFQRRYLRPGVWDGDSRGV